MTRGLSTAFAGIAVGVGLALGGYFVGQTMLNQRIGANTASVKGLSERVVASDTATWTLRLKVRSRDFNAVSTAFDTAEDHANRVRTILETAGFAAEEIYLAPLRKRDSYRSNSEGEILDQFYDIWSEVVVTTDAPERVEPARAPVFALARDGIDIEEVDLIYRFTSLNDIKPEMLREATENARIAANEFASNAGVAVGGIQFASQGGFQIRSAKSDAPGDREIEKMVRVVTTITFYLEN